MGKVMDNVGFTTRKQELQNTAKRELTEDEKMAIRQNLGLYGEYSQVMMSGAFTGFSDYRPPVSDAWLARFHDLSELPKETQDFFGNILPKLFEENKEDWLSGKNLPIYEVDCDGEKTNYQIKVSSNGIAFGEPKQIDYDNFRDFKGVVINWIYSDDTAKITVQMITAIPGTAHKITLTDVTPGRVNQIPSKYLPQSSEENEESLVIQLEDLTINDDEAVGNISSGDWQKINAGAKMPILYRTSDDETTTWYNVIMKSTDEVCAVMYYNGKLMPLICFYND